MRVILVAALVFSAAGQSSPVRTIKDGALDEIKLYVEALPSVTRVVMRPFSTADADLGTGGEGGKEARKSEANVMRTEAPKVLAERFTVALKERMQFDEVAVAEPGATVATDALIVEGKFTMIDPGSRAKRYFAGFGAGKSAVAVSGSVKASDGTLLATFAHKRIGVMGIGGGDSLGKLMSDSRSIGEDIAKFLDAWAKKKNLK